MERSKGAVLSSYVTIKIAIMLVSLFILGSQTTVLVQALLLRRFLTGKTQFFHANSIVHPNLCRPNSNWNLHMSKEGGCGCGGKGKAKEKGGCGCGGKGKAKQQQQQQAPATNWEMPVSSGYFPDPTFRIMNTGEGTVTINANTIDQQETNKATVTNHHNPLKDCQFAQFGPRIPFQGRIEWASPKEAHLPLTNSHNKEQEDDDSVLIVKRGLCSFESKWKAAREIGAKAVILVNDVDEIFLAISDAAAASGTVLFDDTNPPPPPAEGETSTPFVVVPSSVGSYLQDGDFVSIQPHDYERPKCWGTWDTLAETTDKQSSFVLPLFPVSQEPLLPGATSTFRLGKREIEELTTHLQNREETSENSEVTIVVAYCLDPAINVLAERACLAKVNLSNQGSSTSLTAEGIAPCSLRTLVRDSTKAGLGLGLVVPDTKEDNDSLQQSSSSNSQRANDIRARLSELWDLAQISESPHDLPSDENALSFAACRLLNLPPRQMQAALACSTQERLDGIISILDRRISILEKASSRYPYVLKPKNQECGEDFVADAVEKAESTMVSVELPRAAGGTNKAAGFVIGSGWPGGYLDTRDDFNTMGYHPDPEALYPYTIVATNRHVIANANGANVTVTSQSSGKRVLAEVLSVSETYDIAFLKTFDSLDVGVAPLGNSDTLRLGDWTIAMGCPGEFDTLVSLGIASALQKEKGDVAFIGTDALFNKGISGGPLLNKYGDIIGMCTHRREDLNGLGFAISINRVLDALDEALPSSIPAAWIDRMVLG